MSSETEKFRMARGADGIMEWDCRATVAAWFLAQTFRLKVAAKLTALTNS